MTRHRLLLSLLALVLLAASAEACYGPPVKHNWTTQVGDYEFGVFEYDYGSNHPPSVLFVAGEWYGSIPGISAPTFAALLGGLFLVGATFGVTRFVSHA